MRLPKLNLNQIADLVVRDNFRKLQDYLRSESPLEAFALVEASFTALGEQTLPHNLGYQPRDILVTRLSGSGILTFNYDKFTATNLSVTLSGDVSSAKPTAVRLLAGILNLGAS